MRVTKNLKGCLCVGLIETLAYLLGFTGDPDDFVTD